MKWRKQSRRIQYDCSCPGWKSDAYIKLRQLYTKFKSHQTLDMSRMRFIFTQHIEYLASGSVCMGCQ